MDELPRLGLGTYRNTDPDQCAESVRTALELGYRHVDTAQGYGNEAAVGTGLERASVDEDDVFVATKLDTDNLAYEDVVHTTVESRQRLGVKTIDLLYVHWPLSTYDPADTLAALDTLYQDGAIEHVGLSNFTPDLLDEALDTLDAPVFAHQVEMHPYLHQDELLEYAQAHDHWLVAYSPIAKGQVVGDPVLADVAEKHDATEAQVSLAWLLSKDNVAPIPKATGEAHIRENYEALELSLDDEDIARIDAIDREARLVDFDAAPWN